MCSSYDNQGRKRGLQWHAAVYGKSVMGRDTIGHKNDRIAKWDCTGSGDPLILKRAGGKLGGPTMKSDPHIFGGASFYKLQIRSKKDPSGRYKPTDCGLPPGPVNWGNPDGALHEYQAYWDCRREYQSLNEAEGQYSAGTVIYPTWQNQIQDGTKNRPCGYPGEKGGGARAGRSP